MNSPRLRDIIGINPLPPGYLVFPTCNGKESLPGEYLVMAESGNSYVCKLHLEPTVKQAIIATGAPVVVKHGEGLYDCQY